MSDLYGGRHPKEYVVSTDVAGFDSLTELALDMRSAWNHATDQVWRMLDPVLWDITKPLGHPADGLERETPVCAGGSRLLQER